MPSNDPVNHPQHYTSHPSGIECIQVTRYFNFNKGNAIKYIWRSGEKDQSKEIEDLLKAIWYLRDEVRRIAPDYKEFPDLDKTLGLRQVYISTESVTHYNNMLNALKFLAPYCPQTQIVPPGILETLEWAKMAHEWSLSD